MNRATYNLEDDHVFIIELTEIMQKIATSPSLDAMNVEEVVDIIRNFADGLHHAKEEELLFPLMTGKGFSTQNGPIAVMLSDHEQGRQFVKAMAEGAAAMKNSDTAAVGPVRKAMMGYADLLQSHIAKENNVLFRLADQIMEPEEESVLFDRFSALDAGSGTLPEKNTYISRIKALHNQF